MTNCVYEKKRFLFWIWAISFVCTIHGTAKVSAREADPVSVTAGNPDQSKDDGIRDDEVPPRDKEVPFWEEEPREVKRKPHWVGGQLGLGFAGATGSVWDKAEKANMETESAVSYGVWLNYYGYLFSANTLALSIGFGVYSKGVEVSVTDPVVTLEDVVTYLEVPLGFLIDAGGIHFGLAGAFESAVAAKTKKGDQSQDWTDNDWSYINRLNVGLKGMFGVAIPAGKGAITLRADFTIHLLNDLNENTIKELAERERAATSDLDLDSRYYNIMFCLGAMLPVS